MEIQKTHNRMANIAKFCIFAMLINPDVADQIGLLKYLRLIP